MIIKWFSYKKNRWRSEQIYLILALIKINIIFLRIFDPIYFQISWQIRFRECLFALQDFLQWHHYSCLSIDQFYQFNQYFFLFVSVVDQQFQSWNSRVLNFSLFFYSKLLVQQNTFDGNNRFKVRTITNEIL